MLIFHAGYRENIFFVWAEQSEAEQPTRSGRTKGGKGKTNPLTFAADGKAVCRILNEQIHGLNIEKKQIHPLTLWMPTQDGQPQPSSALIVETIVSKGELEICPWMVDAVALSREQATHFLCRLMGKEILTTGVMVGKDIGFWTTAIRLVGSLAARQDYLPGLRKEGENYFAHWTPIYSAKDRERLTGLSQTMPQIALALSEDSSIPPSESGISTLSDFVETMMDYLVRSAQPVEATPVKKKQKSFDSLHDQWLHALQSPDGKIVGEAKDMETLRLQIIDWRRPMDIAITSPYKLCFRLEEPNDQNEPWKVSYLLQGRDDASLLVPAAELWQKNARQKELAFKTDIAKVRQHLLSSLGQAAGVCPRIETSLKTAHPDGYPLDTSGAHEFLTERSWALGQAGFGVLLPAWWTGKGTKLKLTARANVKSPKMQGGSGITMDQIIKFDWQAALGDQVLSPEELQALANLKTPLIQIRGQWVQVNPQEIEAAVEQWRKKSTGEATLRDIVQMAMGAGTDLDGISIESVSATGWIKDFLDKLSGTVAFEQQPVPKGFVGTLRPYQVRGYSWLGLLRQWGLGACLADDMGLGKTIQTLTLVQRDWENNGRRPVLLVCPMSVVGNWKKEAERFTPELPILIHHGLERKKDENFVGDANKNAIVISSYSLLHRDYELFKQIPWSGIVLDEAQNVKNPETKQSKAARALSADYRIALTGTPVENNVGDLWSIMEFLNPGFLGSQNQFKKNFFIPIQVYRDVNATNRLKRLTGPFVLRRVKTDKTVIADLPEKMEMKVYCPLTKEQASLYAAVVEDASNALETSEGIQRRGIILATLIKLKQVCNHPTQFLGDNSALPNRSGKLIRLTEMLEEILQEGDKTLIFTQFSEMGDLLRRYLQEMFGRQVLFLHGKVVKKQRDRMVERFQSNDTDCPIFILSLKAGGTGLNLTRANHVFHFDRWWNPAVENQATDRAFRIGQTKNVQVHKFLCQGTLEEKIDEMIERKKDIAGSIVGAGEAWLTELSNRELKELFALRKETVEE